MLKKKIFVLIKAFDYLMKVTTKLLIPFLYKIMVRNKGCFGPAVD